MFYCFFFPQKVFLSRFQSDDSFTPSQVVPSESQENGQANVEEEMEKSEDEKKHKTSKDTKKSSLSDETSEPQMSVKLEGEPKKGEVGPLFVFYPLNN